MVARQSGPSPTSWRCYSPETLAQDHASYHSGSCYCTRDSQIQQVLSDCHSGRITNTVFKEGDAGTSCYRIPAVVKTAAGSLVAFAEARHGGCGDSGTHEIAFSRSADDGKTWSPAAFAVGSGTFPVGNPWPIALRDGGVVLVFVNHTHGSAGVGPSNGVVISSDDGVSWGPSIDVGAGFGKARGAMPGPGTGVELESGRLIVASHMGAYVDVYISYSDDGGHTWATSESVFSKMDEPTVADLGNNELLLNMRHRGEKSYGRGVARSKDGGVTWSDLTYDSGLKGPVCEGSLAHIGSSVYFSNPMSTSRNHLTVRKSDDGGLTWPTTFEIQSGSSAGYSSLVKGTVGDDSTGGILFESTVTGNINFGTFPLSLQPSTSESLVV